MISPFRYRPPQAAYDAAMGEEGTEETDWADNPVSNFLAYASATVLPAWCQIEHHWTQRLVDYLFTTCPCCMFFRGLTIGILISAVTWLVLSVVVIAILR